MSSENVELVRTLFEALSRGDDEAALALFHPDSEIDWTRSNGPESGIYRGHEGYRQLTSRYREVFDRIGYEALEFIDRGDVVVVPNVATLHHRVAPTTQARSAFVYEVRDGTVMRLTMFQTLEEALAALGV